MAIDKEKFIEYYRQLEQVLTDLRNYQISSFEATSKIDEIQANMRKDGINIEIDGTNFVDNIESNKSYGYEDSYEEDGDDDDN